MGMRNMLKALLGAMLTPHEKLAALQKDGKFTEMFVLSEEVKSYPLSAVWDKFCEINNVPVREDWYNEIKEYEKVVLYERK